MFQPAKQKRKNIIKDDGLEKYLYTPLPSLALTLSSFDLHLLHLSAFGAFKHPHFMQTFLFNNLASASGNLAILITACYFTGNEDILYKYNPRVCLDKKYRNLLNWVGLFLHGEVYEGEDCMSKMQTRICFGCARRR